MQATQHKRQRAAEGYTMASPSSVMARCLLLLRHGSRHNDVANARFFAAATTTASPNITDTTTTLAAEQKRPRAANPFRFNTLQQPEQQPRYQQEPTTAKPKQPVFPSSSWVQMNNIPILSKLDDMLRSVNEVLDFEQDRGIVDLDANTENWDKDQPLPLVQKKDDEEPWVLSAKLVLSTYYRPSGWRLEFANRSIAHAFLQHAEKYTLCCAWKPVTVTEWNNESSENDDKEKLIENNEKNDNKYDDIRPEDLKVSDATVRIENCSNITVDHMRHLMRRFELSTEPPSIRKLTRFRKDILFVVQFQDASWARAAVREMHGVKVEGRELHFCQYPKQLP